VRFIPYHKTLALKKYFVFRLVIMISVLFSCKDKYDPPVTQMNLNYLVVDGTIINGADSTIIRISRTQLLDQNPATKGERDATVTLEDADNNTLYYLIQLNEQGEYTTANINLDQNKKYHLRINTVGGSQYISADLEVKQSPPIDSISWKQTIDGVTVYANTHDPNNNTKYYSWQYTETYDFFSYFYSGIKFNESGLTIIDMFPNRGLQDLVYHCWRSNRSNTILLGSSTKLSADVISESPIRFIPRNAEEISSLYSILVSQFAISKEAYLYFANIKKISEQTGSIFDAQPAELTGNLRCINKPEEPVIGFLNISSLQQQRIFIPTKEVQPWKFSLNCMPERNIPKNLDSIRIFFGGPSPVLLPIAEIYRPPAIAGAPPYCVDCTVRGGTTVKPDFWP